MSRKILFAIMILLIFSFSCSKREDNFIQQTITNQTNVPQVNEEKTPTIIPPTDTKTPTMMPSLTYTPDSQATKTAWAVAFETTRTQEAKPMADQIIQLQKDGYISTSNGIYYPIKNFSENWAQINWYRWWDVGYKLTDFVISLDAKMESAGNNSNWNLCGCGIVFHNIDENNHYFIILTQDGRISLRKQLNGVVSIVKESSQFTTAIPLEKVHFVMVVEGIQIYVFADDIEVLKVRDNLLTSNLGSGEISFSVVSGTNKSFGTHCKMTNIGIWDLNK